MQKPAAASLRAAWAAVLGIMVAQALVLHGMGRVWLCTCGAVRLWVGDIRSPEMSQQVTDWYTFSHVVHGILFYGLLRLLLPRLPILARLAIAVGIEATWEIAENTPWVIEAYRQQALARGYVGDSVLNSLSDTISMMIGFALAARLPWRATVAIAIIMEVSVGYLVHDNLTLNVLNFIHRFPAIEAWQSAVR
ncbi:DUF2585 family protein [Enhydrobacter sp.]|uniref:DUF2585 family protein n=1 Tax=Enhydrobacter sp. TaxID=1894999 RepID=UPI00260E440A|nr:DUF2585 family protein [Enhydrobacter sp.]